MFNRVKLKYVKQIPLFSYFVLYRAQLQRFANWDYFFCLFDTYASRFSNFKLYHVLQSAMILIFGMFSVTLKSNLFYFFMLFLSQKTVKHLDGVSTEVPIKLFIYFTKNNSAIFFSVQIFEYFSVQKKSKSYILRVLI